MAEQLQKLFINTDHNMNKGSDYIACHLSNPIKATHYRLVNCSVPNTGYTFKNTNNKFEYFFSNDGTTPLNSGSITFSTTKRYNMNDLITELNAGGVSNVTFSHDGSFKLTIAHSTTSTYQFFHVKINTKFGIAVDQTIEKNTSRQMDNYVYLASTSCVYISCDSLCNNSVCSITPYGDKRYNRGIIAKIPFSSANSLGDVASHTLSQSGFSQIQNSENEIRELSFTLLDHDFEVYKTNGISSFIEIDFLNMKQQEIDGTKR